MATRSHRPCKEPQATGLLVFDSVKALGHFGMLLASLYGTVASMKILLFSLLLVLVANANEVVYGSKSGTIPSGGENPVTLVDVAAGEAIEIMSVIGGGTADGSDEFVGTNFIIMAKYGELPSMTWQEWQVEANRTDRGVTRSSNQFVPVVNNMLVGPCTIQLDVGDTERASFSYQVSYKITKPSAANTTTSAPILLPPSQDAVQRWFVRLQVSSDLKTWQDVQPGEFLGSDSARFFRIQTTEAQ